MFSSSSSLVSDARDVALQDIDCVLFGAFERHNFGDLLMGYVFERLLGGYGLKVVYASILENDLRNYGGNKVYSIVDLIGAGLDARTPILHVGGEVVPCSFVDSLLADSPLVLDQYRTDVVNKLLKMIDINRPYPYLTPPVELLGGKPVAWGNRIFYGAGFTCNDVNAEIADLVQKTFNGSLYAGFRDHQSLRNALRSGVENARFSPDIVLYISKLLERDGDYGAGYLLLHFNAHFLQCYDEILVVQLKVISGTWSGSIKVALAGTILGADSVGAIKRFIDLAANRGLSIEFLPSMNIFDICRQISEAKIVVSTSLHYRIVAKSYGIPRISMDNPKVSCWSETNDAAYPHGVKPEVLATELFFHLRGIVPARQEQELDIQELDQQVLELSEIIRSVKSGLSSKPLAMTASPPPAPSMDLWLSALIQCLHDKDRQLYEQRTQLSSRRFLRQKLAQLKAKMLAKGRLLRFKPN
jgi:hypothetical protein